MRKEELVSKVNSMISNIMIEAGFMAKKNGVLWGRYLKGSKNELFLLVQQRGDSVSLHVRAEFTRKDISLKLSEFEDLTRISLGLEPLRIKRATCSVTDWKELFLDEQNAAWLGTFTCIEELSELQPDFIRLAEVAVHWFEQIDDVNTIKAHLLSRGMTMSCMTYLVVDFTTKSDLQDSYNILFERLGKSKGCDFNEVRKLYEIIQSSTQ